MHQYAAFADALFDELDGSWKVPAQLHVARVRNSYNLVLEIFGEEWFKSVRYL